jgi:hypothetical protein
MAFVPCKARGLFRQPRAARDRGDRTTLTQLWGKAQPQELGVRKWTRATTLD